MKGFILKGLPGSGKSTLRNQLLAEGKATIYLNKDEIREQLPELSEKEIHKLYLDKLELACTSGESIVLDNTHLNQKTVNQFKAVLERHGYEIEEITMNTPVQECIIRDNYRRNRGERYTGRSVIIQMAMRYGLYHTGDVQSFYVSDEVVIFDIDGTLANIEHRRQYVQQKPKNWREFHGRLHLDTVNTPVYNLYQLCRGRYTILLVSGRGEEYRKQTEKWLEDNNIYDYHALFMRNRADYRDDTIVKEEIYNQFIKPYFKVQFAVDDRDRVVKMWREKGITVFQCAEGNF